MPGKPLKPCAHLRCPKLTTERYCEDHKVIKVEDKAIANKQYDKYQRDKRSTTFYKSKAWRELRDHVFQKQHGLCQSCLRLNRFVSGHVVDHKIPIKKDWNQRLNEGNLQVLCHKCHNMKTKSERK